MRNTIFKVFFNSITDPVVFIGKDYKIVEANHSFLSARGLTKSQAVGKACYALVPAKKPCNPCPVNEAFKTGMPSTAAHLYTEGGKTRHIQIDAIPLEGREVAVEITRDISEAAYAKSELEEKVATLKILEMVSRQWTEAENPKDIFEKVCDCILREFGYKMAWVGLLDEAGRKVKPVFSTGFEEGYLSKIEALCNGSPLGSGPTGTAIKTGQAKVISDIREDPEYEPWRQEAVKRGYLSSAAFPLISKGKTIGALNIYSDRPDAFLPRETAIINALCVHVTTALEHSMLLSTIIKGKTEWEETFDSIASPIFIHDLNYKVVKANKAYREVSGFGFEDIIGKPYWEIFPKMDGPLPSCKKAIESGNTEEKTGEIKTPSGGTFISDAFPIYEEGKPVAFVHVFKDISKLKKAQERIKEEARISHFMLELTATIGRLMDIGAILEEVSKTIMKLISTERTVAFLRHEEEDDYRAAAFHGWPEYLIPVISTFRLRVGEVPAMDMILRGEDVSVEDAASSELIGKRLADTLNLRAVIISPFITGEGVMGALMAERQERFSEKDKYILKGITSNTAIAVENARLYKESIEMAADLARRMETIRTTYEIDRAILSSLNRKEILEVATKNTQRIIPADKVITVQINDKEAGYAYGTEVIPFGASSLLDSVLRTGRVVSVPDLSLHRHTEPVIMNLIREGFGSLIALPLHTKGKRFGCIIMAGKRVAAFDKDDISSGEKLTAQIAIALENAKLYEDIKEIFISILKALVNAVDAKSPWTKGHSERVTGYALMLGREMELKEEELEKLRLASLLHDIGKIGTYDALLDKPEKLTDAEFDLVKMHPGKGAEIIKPISQLANIIPIIRGHHEKMDGSGYPDGLRGDEIPLLARILCVVDSFDSMTADRPYRSSPGREFAVEELKKCSGAQFDPNVVAAFLKAIEAVSTGVFT
ncbi:MAG: GAF domain-containing protein [Thermodesulfovibrionales bacterium]|nr:GAF domain-containing protein [Thermodesulfovibrionales bacterium]